MLEALEKLVLSNDWILFSFNLSSWVQNNDRLEPNTKVAVEMAKTILNLRTTNHIQSGKNDVYVVDLWSNRVPVLEVASMSV